MSYEQRLKKLNVMNIKGNQILSSDSDVEEETNNTNGVGPGDIEVMELSEESEVGDETGTDVSVHLAAESAGLERKRKREAPLDDATDVSVRSAA